MDTKRLNINFAAIPSVGYVGSESAFDEIEQLVGKKVPSGYVLFIREADGGHPEVGSFTTLVGPRDNWFDVDLFYSIGTVQEVNVKDMYARWQHLLGKHSLPIGRDGGGNQIYLDLSDQQKSVWIYLHDENHAKVKIADCFEEFISSLRINPDFV